jgi:hypothetical protein
MRTIRTAQHPQTGIYIMFVGWWLVMDCDCGLGFGEVLAYTVPYYSLASPISRQRSSSQPCPTALFFTVLPPYKPRTYVDL